MRLRCRLHTKNDTEKTEERNERDDPHSSQKREPGIGLFPGTGRLGCAWLLDFSDWKGNNRQDRTRHRRSSGGCGSVGPVWSAQSSVASAWCFSLAPGSGLLRLSRPRPLRRWSARPECSIRADLCPQLCAAHSMGTVTELQ